MVEIIAVDADLVEIVAADAKDYPRGILHLVGEGHVSVLREQIHRRLHLADIEMFARAEIVDVEDERRVESVADGHLHVIARLFVYRLYILQRRELGVEPLHDLRIVVRGRQQNGIAAASVATRAARLLIVTLQRVAHRIVHHETHVGLVDTHAESVRGHHNAHLARGPLLLPHGALGVRQSRMIVRHGVPLPAQRLGHLLASLARSHVDYPRPFDTFDHAQQLFALVIRMPHGVREIRARETAAQDVRLGKSQTLHYILRHQCRGRGGKGQHGGVGNESPYLGDPEIRRAEIVAPLRYAVRLVHRQQRDVHALHAQAERLRSQTLGGDI